MRVVETGLRWRYQPGIFLLLLLLLLLASCRAPLTSAAAVADDATLKYSGRDPGIPPDIPTDISRIHSERDRVLEGGRSHVRNENKSDVTTAFETIGGNLSPEEKITVVSAAQRGSSNAIEKPVFQINRLISPGFVLSEQADKLRNTLSGKKKKTAMPNSKIQNKSDTTREDTRNPGIAEASVASIDGLGASSPSLAPRTDQRRDATAHAGAGLAKSDREMSLPGSSVVQVAPGIEKPGVDAPIDSEIASQGVSSSPSDDGMLSSSTLSNPGVNGGFERRGKLSSGMPLAIDKQYIKLGKKRWPLLKTGILDGSANTFDGSVLERNKVGWFTEKSSLSRLPYAGSQESFSPTLKSSETYTFSDSNDGVHLKDESLLEDSLLANVGSSESDAEAKPNIVKRSASDSPGIEDNPPNLIDQEGPTGHVMHRGIMENFADDFMRSPVDLQFADDYFNHEPYHYDIYYDDSMNSDFPTDEDIGVEEVVNQGSSPDKLTRTYPWEGETDTNDATEDTNDNFEEVENALELRLLGPDFQSELGYVLERLANDTQQRNRRHQVPVRHHDPRYSEGISVGVTEGTCPPPVHSLPPGLCLAPPCTSHMMCYPQKMCCFNGCTYTCTEPIQPPPVVDWLEDSDFRLPILDPLNPALPLRFESSPLSYGTGGEETVRLPGGCSLSATKYEELKQFMTAESIQDCLCSGGEVVCVVKSSPSN